MSHADRAIDIRPESSDDRSGMQAGANLLRILCLVLLLLNGTPLFAQREMMTFGAKGGAQINPSIHLEDLGVLEKQTNYKSPILGITFEKPLSHSISIEVDSLYQQEKLSYHQARVCGKSGCFSSEVNWETHGHALEFPVVLKKYWDLTSPNRIFADIGVSARAMKMSPWAMFTCPPTPTPSPFCNFVLQDTHGNFGFAIGGGLDFRAGSFHLYPELRYTRWINTDFADGQNGIILHRNADALSVLFGFSYGYRR